MGEHPFTGGASTINQYRTERHIVVNTQKVTKHIRYLSLHQPEDSRLFLLRQFRIFG